MKWTTSFKRQRSTKYNADQQKMPLEWEEQERIVQWLRDEAIKFYSVPNGCRRTMREAMFLKRTGLEAGVPDLCIPVPTAMYHGLYIELKRTKSGQVTKSQREWLAYLNKSGYKAEIARGFDHARQIVLEYLNKPL